jgi:hypothetical protein
LGLVCGHRHKMKGRPLVILIYSIIMQSALSMVLMSTHKTSFGRLLMRLPMRSFSTLLYNERGSSQKLSTSSPYYDHEKFSSLHAREIPRSSRQIYTATNAISGADDSTISAKSVHHIVTTPLKAMCKLYHLSPL